MPSHIIRPDRPYAKHNRRDKPGSLDGGIDDVVPFKQRRFRRVSPTRVFIKTSSTELGTSSTVPGTSGTELGTPSTALETSLRAWAECSVTGGEAN